MADLGTIGFASPLDADDTTYGDYFTNNTTGTGGSVAMDTTPSDLGNVDTLTMSGVALCNTSLSNDSIQLEVRIMDGATVRSFIGARSFGSGGITGKIAHVVVWDVNLASGDVTDFLDGKDPANIDSANQTRYWPFPGAGASDLTDEIVSETLTNSGVTYDSTDNPPIQTGNYSTVYKLNIS